MSGFYRNRNGHPVAFWRDVAGEIICLSDGERITDDRRFEIWMRVAKKPVSKADYDHRRKSGAWPADLPPIKPLTGEKADALNMDATPLPAPAPAFSVIEAEQHPNPGPGHNSGDLSTFREMREALAGDVAEARAFFSKNQIRTKTDADRAENWRKRINDAAKAMEDRRKVEKKPFQDAADEVDARYFPVIRDAQAQAKTIGGLADAWARAEQDRLKKEAEAVQRAAYERERQIAETERNRIEAERAAKLAKDPIAALTDPEPVLPDLPPPPAPIVVAPKVLMGTSGTRRSAREAPATATIVDLAAVAKFYADQSHPALVELLQKLVDKAAKARTPVSGAVMSWERKDAAE